MIGPKASTCVSVAINAPAATATSTTAGIGSATCWVTTCAVKAENMNVAPWAKLRMPIVLHARAMPSANTRYTEPRATAFRMCCATPIASFRHANRRPRAPGPSGAAGVSGVRSRRTPGDELLARAVPADEDTGHPHVAPGERELAHRALEAVLRDLLQAPFDAVPARRPRRLDRPRQPPHAVVAL